MLERSLIASSEMPKASEGDSNDAMPNVVSVVSDVLDSNMSFILASGRCPLYSNIGATSMKCNWRVHYLHDVNHALHIRDSVQLTHI